MGSPNSEPLPDTPSVVHSIRVLKSPLEKRKLVTLAWGTYNLKLRQALVVDTNEASERNSASQA